MKKRFVLTFMIVCLLFILSACGEKGPIESTEDFGEIEQTEASTEDEFAIGQDNKGLPGYEVKETTKSAQERESEVLQELEAELARIEETRDYEQESRDALVSEIKTPSGEIVDLTEIEDGTVEVLVEKVIEGEITDIETIKAELEKAGYDEEYEGSLEAAFEEMLVFWDDIHKRVAEDPILDEELLEQYPELRYYTQSEWNEIEVYMESVEESACGFENIDKSKCRIQ